MLPIGVNPWVTERIAVASLDYVKRPEVLPAVAACPWDIVIVDEAHGASGDSDRQAAVRTLASRAAYVLLLTATPHSGDHQAFRSLCGFGAVGGDPLLVFRRTRADVRSGTKRRVHALHVRPNGDESRMHALLVRYTSAIRAEHPHAWLATSVLHKRALSSAWALAQSLERRLDTLSRVDSGADAEQLTLPLGDPDGELTLADQAPLWPMGVGLADSARERRMLGSLLAAARSAAAHETKLHALARLLRRSNERALVFTEYRDTLAHIRSALAQPAALSAWRPHPQSSASQRSTDFSSGRCRILLATDAAGEGLNLQDGCRLVVNLELPWNPMRLEQRIGRVDRIGQRRTVHAVHLIGAGTGETRILARLQARIAKARTEIGAPDPVGADEELAVAQLVLAGTADAQPESGHAGQRCMCPRVTGSSRRCRRRGRQARVRPQARPPQPRPWRQSTRRRWTVDRARSPMRALRVRQPHRPALAGRVRQRTRTDSSSPRWSPFRFRSANSRQIQTRGWVEGLLRHVEADVRPALDRATADWRADATRAVRRRGRHAHRSGAGDS